MSIPRAPSVLHATTIAYRGRGLVIRGASGSGKSALAMEMIGLGAVLVADDRTVIAPGPEVPRAAPPVAIAGLIEVRGLGLLRLDHQEDVPVAAVLDLDRLETERLPPMRRTELCGQSVALYSRIPGAHFATALLHCLAGARVEP